MTKFGIDQVENVPPQWWRRLERALIIIVVPAAATFSSTIVEDDKIEVIILSSLTFFTGIVKGIGVFFGTEVAYPQEQTNEL